MQRAEDVVLREIAFFGIIHGLTYHETDFTPRAVFGALQNTNALFSEAKLDPSIEIAGAEVPSQFRADYPFLAYGFRALSGKAIVAYWLAGHRDRKSVV